MIEALVTLEYPPGKDFRLPEPLLRLVVQHSVRGDYAKLKRLLENQP